MLEKNVKKTHQNPLFISQINYGWEGEGALLSGWQTSKDEFKS